MTEDNVSIFSAAEKKIDTAFRKVNDNQLKLHFLPSSPPRILEMLAKKMQLT